MSEPIDELGREIRARRKAVPMRLSELAAAADISQQYLSDIETGRRLPPPVTIRRIADALGADPIPLIWLWLLNQVGHDTADALARYAR